MEYHIDLKPGTILRSYLDSLNASLRPIGAAAQPNHGSLTPTVAAMDTLAAMLTLMLVAVAGLGVLNTVVLDTRERVHDLGVFKALGMTPRQMVTTVITSVAGIGLFAGAIGVPIGIWLHHRVLPTMGAAAGTRIPAIDIDIYHAFVLLPVILGGLAIAVAGALLPASWVARTRTATALRIE